MYRSGVKPWQSAGWRPSVKHVNEASVSEIREVKEEKGEKESEEA